jgi:hypothetical protein
MLRFVFGNLPRLDALQEGDVLRQLLIGEIGKDALLDNNLLGQYRSDHLQIFDGLLNAGDFDHACAMLGEVRCKGLQKVTLQLVARAKRTPAAVPIIAGEKYGSL